MKKVLSVIAFAAFAACSQAPVQKIAVEEWVDGIVRQYPNLHSNDISNSIVRDSVAAYTKRFVGGEAALLSDVKFRFVKMTEKADSFTVFFDATNCYSDIDNETVPNGHIFTDINIRVVSKVDKGTAAGLDKSHNYFIEGKVHAWDENDRFFITNHTGDYIDLGTFILDDIVIHEVVNEQ